MGWPGKVETLSPQLFQDQKEKRVLIGPEGGWSAHELELFRIEAKLGKLHATQLGNLVLRAETAALFTLSCALSGRLGD
jgi:RsmE family RNA methyltransferase